MVAEDGFDPSTSGLWAQHASAALIIRHSKDACLLLERSIYLNKFSPILMRRIGISLWPVPASASSASADAAAK